MGDDGASQARVFISYSSADREFARFLDGSLAAAGVATFLAERDLKVGDSIPERIFGEIAAATSLIYVVSRASVRSPWVREELGVAKIRAMEGKGFGILPLLLDDVTLPPSVSHIKYADFRDWRDATSYRKTVLELLQSLGGAPVLIGQRQILWYLDNLDTLKFVKHAVSVLHTRTDTATGYFQWFDSWHWSVKYAASDDDPPFFSAMDRLEELLAPVADGDQRLRALRDCIEPAKKAVVRGSRDPGDRGESSRRIREVVEVCARMLAILNDLEGDFEASVHAAIATRMERP
ncbi:toll/interleukin-1 receptor domain-containing protein [Sphaerisporangium sp. NPDC005288]|uniref:toll/interleukin-1 receptor domain-containing protein n=1 Tax=Sphaerisporangium sp. NPDC005288 TaxID=3155114 RepID=UPI00339FAFC2